jgi:hypothetical protein
MPVDSSAAEQAERAFRAGDWRTARRLARQVVADGDADAAAREAAKRLLHRTGVDPLVPALIAVCLALFALVALVFR